MPKDRIVGLDIGTSKIRIVAAETESSRLVELLCTGETPSKGVVNGTVVNHDAAVLALTNAVERAQERAHVRISRVVVGLSGTHIASLNSRSVVAVTRTSRRLASDDLQRALEQSRVIVLPPDREIIHCIPRSYRVDGQNGFRNPIGMYGNRLEMDAHIVTGNFSHTQNFLSAVRSAGLQTIGAILSPLAAAEAVVTQDEKKLGVMLVDIGEGTTDIAIIKDSAICYSSIIAIGGGDITSDLCAALLIDRKTAEKIKLTYVGAEEESRFDGERGQEYSQREAISSIVQSRLVEMFTLIRAELIKSGCYNLLPAGVVLCGGCVHLCGTSAACANILKMPVRIGTVGGVDEPGEANLPPEFATAVGLVKYAAANRNLMTVRGPKDLSSGLRTLTDYLQTFFERT